MIPFDLLPLAPARRRREPRENAFIELHNVIAAAQTVQDFGPRDRDRISRQRGVDLTRDFLAQRRQLYEDLLAHLLATRPFLSDDRWLLAHVARTLALSDADLRPVHERSFGGAVEHALADDRLSEDERLLLYRLQHVLGLDPDVADGAYGVLARGHLLKTVARVLGDGTLSPEEQDGIRQLAADLSIEVPADLHQMLAQARGRWEERHGAIVPVESPLALDAGETARYRAEARWQYAHAGRLEKALGHTNVRAGRTQGETVSDALLTGQARDGEVVVTDHRVLLVPGRAIPEILRLPAVTQTLRFLNGTVIRMASGRSMFIDVHRGREAFYTALYRAVEDVRDAQADVVATDARWRKVLVDEVRTAESGWFLPVRPQVATRRLASGSFSWDAWQGPGDVAVTPELMIFSGSEGRLARTSLRTINGIHRHKASLWIERRYAHDWVVRCQNETEAIRLQAALRGETREA